MGNNCFVLVSLFPNGIVGSFSFRVVTPVAGAITQLIWLLLNRFALLPWGHNTQKATWSPIMLL